MTLADQPAGHAATIAAIRSQNSMGERLMEMGVTPGARVTVLRQGDPLQVLVRDYCLSLRRADALQIDIH